MGIRTDRVARLLQKEIADLLLSDFNQEIPGFVTVTGVRVTADLSIAYTYLSVLAKSRDEEEAVFRHVDSLTASIRLALAGRIRHQVRKIPEIRFFLDDVQEHVARMETLFEEIRQDRSRREASDEDD